MEDTDMHTDSEGHGQAIRDPRVARTALDYAKNTSKLDTALHSLLGVRGYLRSADSSVKPICYARYVECILKPATRFADDTTLQAAALEILVAFAEDVDGYRILTSMSGVREFVQNVAESHLQHFGLKKWCQKLTELLDKGVPGDGGEAVQGAKEVATSSITSQTSFTLPTLGGADGHNNPHDLNFNLHESSLASRRHVVVSDSPTIMFEGVPPCTSGGSISSVPASSTPSPAASGRPVMQRLQDLEFEVAALKLTVAAQQQALQEERSSKEALEKRLIALEMAISG